MYGIVNDHGQNPLNTNDDNNNDNNVHVDVNAIVLFQIKHQTQPEPQLDGTDYTQSLALLRYAGKIGGLYPEDPLAALKVGSRYSFRTGVGFI